MIQKLKNKTGAVLTLSMVGAVMLLMTPAVLQKLDGEKAPTFKQDGKRIWCKIMNRDADVCDALYGG